MAGNAVFGGGDLSQLSTTFDPLANTLLGWFLPEETLAGMATSQMQSFIVRPLGDAGSLSTNPVPARGRGPVYRRHFWS